MNLRPVTQLLEDAGIGAQGSTLFINQMPMECADGILLRNKLAGTHIDYELPGYFKTLMQVIARSKSYERGEELMNLAVQSLTISETQIDGMFVKYMRPKTLPVVFPLSKGNLLETTCEFEVVFTQ